MSPPPVTIELLGVARLLARRETVEMTVAGEVTLAALLRAVAAELPALVATVLAEDGTLLAGHTLSRDGVELLRDPGTPVSPGDRLMLLSTSAGG